jgi:hypothetical protein
MLSRKPLLFKSFTIQTVKEFDVIYDKEYQKDTASTRSGVYPIEKTVGNDPWVLGDISRWMSKTGFWCFWSTAAFT